MSNDKLEERRRNDRFITSDAWVEFADSGLRSLFRRATPTRAPIDDLSRAGFRMISPVQLKPDKRLSVKITVPFIQIPVEVHAIVVWCHIVPRLRGFPVGVKFVGHDVKFRNWMDEFEEKSQETGIMDKRAIDLGDTACDQPIVTDEDDEHNYPDSRRKGF